MKILEFRKLIREEIRRALMETKLQEVRREETPDQKPNRAYYMYVDGTDAVQGDPIASTKDIVNMGMEPSDVKNVGPVYMSKVTTSIGTYTTYLITSATNKRDNWFVVAPFDKALVKHDYLNPEHKDAIYGMWKRSMANKSNAKQISFDDYLKAKV